MLKNLLEKRAALLARCDELQQAAAAASREMTEAEQTEFRTKLDEAKSLNPKIKELEDLAAQQRESEAANQRAAAQPQQQRPNVGGTGATVHDNREDEEFRDFAQQLIAVRDACSSGRSTFDPRLRRFDLSDVKVRAAAGMSEGVGGDGGFLVMTDVAAPMAKEVFETGILASRVSTIPISSNANGVKIPFVDETSRANGSRWGGIRGYWLAEAEAPTSSKPKFGVMELGLKKVGAVCHVTDELLQDSAALASYLQQAVNEELAFMLDDAIYEGAGGGGVPLGFKDAPCTITVSKESSQAADTILYQNVSKMRSRMPSRSFLRSVWLVNVDCQPQLEQLFVPHKNVAGTENVSGQSVFVPPNGAADAPFGRLFGRPILPIEQASTIGDLGDIMLVDPTMYLLAQKGGIEQASSIHVNFLTDQTAFRFIMRVDGQPKLKSAITPFKGSNTLSAFIKLEAR